MSARTSRRKWGTVSPLLIAALFVVECSGDSTAGANDVNATNTTGGGPSAGVRALPQVSFPSCTSAGCTVQGTLVNDGPDCAVSVQGVTHLLDGAGAELGTVSWSFDYRLRPGHDETFSGCCVTPAVAQATRSSRTEITFRALQCI